MLAKLPSFFFGKGTFDPEIDVVINNENIERVYKTI